MGHKSATSLLYAYNVRKGFLGCVMVKNLPAKQETWVQSWGQEDPLAKEMVFHSSIFALETPWTEEPGRLQSMSSPKESDTTL